MGAWTDAVERKARIIHEQMSAARALALRNDADAGEVEGPYLELLNELYREEFQFAHLVDSSDLVARFSGPAVSGGSLPVSVVTSMFSNLRKQIQGIASSIVGLATDKSVRWPMGLDPLLAGVSHGSLVVGICIPGEGASGVTGQRVLPEVSEPIRQAVRNAVKSVADVPRYVREDGVDDAIAERFPDPAIRDTVLVAASRLAPTGRRGIDRLAFYGPEDVREEGKPLTVRSRRVLSAAVARPVRVSGRDSFVGVVRQIDLDARRFEIRQVANVGAIRCAYTAEIDDRVRQILDRRVRIDGQYEALADQKPRLVQVASMEVVNEGHQGELL